MLDRLKNDMGARHIPVCVISTDEARERAFRAGAMAFVDKPIQSKEVLDAMLDQLHAYLARPQKSVLVALKDVAARREFAAPARGRADRGRPWSRAATSCSTRWRKAASTAWCWRTVSPASTRTRCRRLLAAQAELGPLPVMIYRGGGRDAGKFAWHSDDTVTVHEAHTVPKLFDHALLALHRNLARLPEAKRSLVNGIHESTKPLAGKRVLIVDDDMRNIFALATVLEEHGMEIVSADNGRDAIRRVASDPQIDIVLMDIMMPEMDGMETMREIRKLPAGKDLPIIAVTAKAMKGDREKCIEAGAWDYLSKPVDTQDLLAVLRAWLHQ